MRHLCALAVKFDTRVKVGADLRLVLGDVHVPVGGPGGGALPALFQFLAPLPLAALVLAVDLPGFQQSLASLNGSFELGAVVAKDLVVFIQGNADQDACPFLLAFIDCAAVGHQALPAIMAARAASHSDFS